MSKREAITDELLLELGRLLVAANGLDAAVFELYAELTNRPRPDVIKDDGRLTLGPLVAKFVAELRNRVRDPRLLATFDRIAPRLQAAVDRRNEFIHASWWHAGDETAYQRHRRRPRGGGEEMVEFSPSEVFGVTHELWAITGDIVALREDLAAANVPGVTGYSLD